MDAPALITQTVKEALLHKALLREAVWTHLHISGLALGIAAIIGMPLGFACSRYQSASHGVGMAFNTLRAIPGLALLAFLIPILGTGTLPTVVALIILALPSILLNTMAGFRQVGPLPLETARGLGLSAPQVFMRVEVPVALPYLLTGLRVACVEVISGATLAAFIGGGGLGTLIVNGLNTYNIPLLLIGALPIAGMALAIELGFNRLIRHTTRYQSC